MPQVFRFSEWLADDAVRIERVCTLKFPANRVILIFMPLLPFRSVKSRRFFNVLRVNSLGSITGK